MCDFTSSSIILISGSGGLGYGLHEEISEIYEECGFGSAAKSEREYAYELRSVRR